MSQKRKKTQEKKNQTTDLIRSPSLDAALEGLDIRPNEEVKLPQIPNDMWDELYSLPTSPQCRVSGLEKDCIKVCESGENNVHGENLFLLPGEDDYLRERFAEKGIEWKWTYREPPVVVPLGKECPYLEGRVCSIHDDRPFVCRSYPLRVHRTGNRSLTVYSAMGCPYSKVTVESLKEDQHHNIWIAAWKALIPYVPKRWWVSFARAVPSGFQMVCNIVDPSEGGIPVAMVAMLAKADCSTCEGQGWLEDKQQFCSCIDKKAKKKLIKQIERPRNSFNADW